MKTLYIVLIALVFSLKTKATIITCSNNVLTAGQYNTIQAAVTAANYGDTVYVTPSPTDYGTVTINKKITLLGGGWYTTGTQNNYVSWLDDIIVDSSFAVNSVSGIRLQGLKFKSFYINNSRTANNIIIERCHTGYNNVGCGDITVFGYGWIIRQNVIDCYGIFINYKTNLIISNNIFVNSRMYNSSSPTVIIANNLFSYGASYSYFQAISYALVANNIFFYWYNGNPTTACSQCIFNSNISYSLYPFTFPGANNSGGNNFDNVDPQFVGSNLSTGNNYQSFDQIVSNNWNLKTTSPGYKKGTDGTDVGLYGGLFPPTGNFAGVPYLPQIQLFNINTSIIQQGGTLNTTVKARKQN